MLFLLTALTAPPTPVAVPPPLTAVGGAGGPAPVVSRPPAAAPRMVVQRGRLVPLDESKLEEEATTLTARSSSLSCCGVVCTQG